MKSDEINLSNKSQSQTRELFQRTIERKTQKEIKNICIILNQGVHGVWTLKFHKFSRFSRAWLKIFKTYFEQKLRKKYFLWLCSKLVEPKVSLCQWHCEAQILAQQHGCQTGNPAWFPWTNFTQVNQATGKSVTDLVYFSSQWRSQLIIHFFFYHSALFLILFDKHRLFTKYCESFR